jgi:hypothetical protein
MNRGVWWHRNYIPVILLWPLRFHCAGNLVESTLKNVYLRESVNHFDGCVRDKSSVVILASIKISVLYAL